MEKKLKHLEMLQEIIQRQTANSFSLRGWNVVLVSAIFALAGGAEKSYLVFLAYLPAFAFWSLDGFYLHQERLFRKLYDRVRLTSEGQIDFSMNTDPVAGEVAPWICVMFSRTLALFHGAIVLTITLVWLVPIMGSLAAQIGKPIESAKGDSIMVMKRAFFSFDFDEDQALKVLMAGQIKLPDSPFSAADWSMKEAAKQSEWEEEAEGRISRSDVVVVLVGAKTHKAPGVLKEVAIARRLPKPIVQIIGYKNTSPTRVPDAGRLLAWTWDNMTNVLSEQ